MGGVGFFWVSFFLVGLFGVFGLGYPGLTTNDGCVMIRSFFLCGINCLHIEVFFRMHKLHCIFLDYPFSLYQACLDI